MKAKSGIGVAFAGVVLMSLTVMTSCGGLWTASAGAGPDYYGYGIDNDWYPSLPGAPLISPVYWGNRIYPGASLPPLPPGAVANPGPVVNQPVGNVRPGNAGSVKPTLPVTRPGSVVPPSGGFNPDAVTGGQPGVQLPPAGSGMKPTRK